MIMRLQNHAQGILNYLVYGKALSGGEHRNNYDDRIKISGDWSATKATLDWLCKNRNWNNNYTHMTLSFSPVEAAKIADLGTEERDKMCADLVQMAIKHYAPHRADEDLVHYAEYHDPIKKRDNNGQERLPHIHLVLPRLDMKTGNQLRIIPKDDAWMAAIQSKINSKYPELLTDPAWVVLKNKEDNISRKDPSKKSLSKKAAEKLSSYLYEKKPRSGAELCELLRNYEDIAPNSDIKFVATKNRSSGKTKNIYLSIKGMHNGKPIGNLNLVNANFEFLNPLYDQYKTLSDDPAEHKSLREAFVEGFGSDKRKVIGLLGGSKIEKHQEKLKRKREKETLGRGTIAANEWVREKLIQDRFDNWIKHDKPNRISTKEALERQRRYDEFNDKFEQDIRSFSSGQRSFFVMYQSNIQHRFVGEGVFYKDSKTDKITYSNKQHKFRLIDHGSKITASTAKETDLRVVARLMIEQGLSKGWDINTIEFWGGNDEWIRVAYDELEWRKSRDVPEPVPTFNSAVKFKNTKQREYPTQRVEESLKQSANRKATQICNTINSSFSLESIELTATKLNLNLGGRTIKIEERGGKKRIVDVESNKHYSAIDFFTKLYGQPISEVAPAFNQAITDAKFNERNANDASATPVTSAAISETQNTEEPDISYINKSQEELSPNEPETKPQPLQRKRDPLLNPPTL